MNIDTNPDSVFRDNPVISYILKSPLYYHDLKKGLEIGYTPQQLEEMYYEAMEEGYLTTITDHNGRRHKL